MNGTFDLPRSLSLQTMSSLTQSHFLASHSVVKADVYFIGAASSGTGCIFDVAMEQHLGQQHSWEANIRPQPRKNRFVAFLQHELTEALIADHDRSLDLQLEGKTADKLKSPAQDRANV
jgi:hypothetical protein